MSENLMPWPATPIELEQVNSLRSRIRNRCKETIVETPENEYRELRHDILKYDHETMHVFVINTIYYMLTYGIRDRNDRLALGTLVSVLDIQSQGCLRTSMSDIEREILLEETKEKQRMAAVFTEEEREIVLHFLELIGHRSDLRRRVGKTYEGALCYWTRNYKSATCD